MIGFIKKFFIFLFFSLWWFVGADYVSAQQKQVVVISKTIERQIFSLMDEQYLYDIDLIACRQNILDILSRKVENKVFNEENTIEIEKLFCLDEYSRYTTREEARDYSIRLSGSLGGIGIGIQLTDKQKIKVVKIYKNSPAEKSGIMEGDILFKIREAGTDHFKEIKDIRDAVTKIRGRPGSKIFLQVKRGDTLIILPPITRRIVEIDSVEHKKIGNIGYIRIKSFTSRTGDELEDALIFLNARENTSGVIIDLRDNVGGLLDSALESLYYFSSNPRDVLLTVKMRDRRFIIHTISDPLGCNSGSARCGYFVYKDTSRRKTPGNYADFKIVILINKGSASASELFAGTMKDWGSVRGNFVVVGESSFGKGVGQSVIPLRNGGRLHLTTFEFLVGNERTIIHERGVSPTYIVDDTREKLEDSLTERDNQFQEALSVLRKM